MNYTSIDAKKELAQALLRTHVHSMRLVELDLAVALLLGKDVQLPDAGLPGLDEPPLVDVGGQWVPFSPTTHWDHYGELVSTAGLVQSTLLHWDDPTDPDKVTGRSYRVHGYYGGVQSEGHDLRLVAARAAALLLQYQVTFSPDWGNR